MAGSRRLKLTFCRRVLCASLWQLYKSIDSPYKAVLKHCYWKPIPGNTPTHDCWRKIQTAFARRRDCIVWPRSLLHVLERVTEYLTAIEDFTRLDLYAAASI